jgi:hypothetical protein
MTPDSISVHVEFVGWSLPPPPPRGGGRRIAWLEEIAVGPDERNRTMLSPFGARTGRKTPSNTRFLFGPAVWLRGLIKPPAARALAYIDWSSQEVEWEYTLRAWRGPSRAESQVWLPQKFDVANRGQPAATYFENSEPPLSVEWRPSSRVWAPRGEADRAHYAR